MQALIPTRIAPSVPPSDATPARVEREFERRLEDGAELQAMGTARKRPTRLLSLGYRPRYSIRLFGTTYYLSDARQNDDIRFFVGYVAQERDPKRIYARLFYKDNSLVWRAASHFVRSDRENWVGKGDTKILLENGHEYEASSESTTDLPHEVQTAFETLGRRKRRVAYDDAALALVVRRAPHDRIRAYRDFTAPRRKAQADPRNLVNGGRDVARFIRKNDPSSLRFVKGFEPDFARGILEVAASVSKLYGGRLGRYRILSKNRKIQYLFLSGARHVWIIPPQATTTELSSYGVRTIDVSADEDLFVPGYEYHFGDGFDDRSALFNQIPAGYVGEITEDASRADSSKWLDSLPVIREFRRKVLKRRPPRARATRSRSPAGSRRLHAR